MYRNTKGIGIQVIAVAATIVITIILVMINFPGTVHAAENAGTSDDPIVIATEADSVSAEVTKNDFTYFEFTPEKPGAYHLSYDTKNKLEVYCECYYIDKNGREKYYELECYASGRMIEDKDCQTYFIKYRLSDDSKYASDTLLVRIANISDKIDGRDLEHAMNISTNTTVSPVYNCTKMNVLWIKAELNEGQKYEISLGRVENGFKVYRDYYVVNEVSFDGEEYEYNSLEWDTKDKNTELDDVPIFTARKTGTHYFRFYCDFGTRYAFSVKLYEARAKIDGKIHNNLSVVKGAVEKEVSAKAVNGTNSKIDCSLVIYDSDMTTVLDKTEKNVSSGMSFYVNKETDYYVVYDGCKIGKNNIEYKYHKADTWYCYPELKEGTLYEYPFETLKNACDKDMTLTIDLVEDKTGKIRKKEGEEHTLSIEIRKNSLYAYENLSEDGIYEPLGKVVYDRCEYDKINNNLTLRFHKPECDLTKKQASDIEEYFSKAKESLAEANKEFSFKYIDPEKVNIPHYADGWVIQYLYSGPGVLNKTGIKTSLPGVQNGAMALTSTLKVRELYIDEQCQKKLYCSADAFGSSFEYYWYDSDTDINVEMNDSKYKQSHKLDGIPEKVYAQINYEINANCRYSKFGPDTSGSVDLDLTEYEKKADALKVVAVNLVKVSEPSENAVQKIKKNIENGTRLSAGLEDLKGLNATVAQGDSFNGNNMMIQDVGTLIGTANTKSYRDFVGEDTGISLSGKVFDSVNPMTGGQILHYNEYNNVSIGGIMECMLYYFVDDVFYGYAAPWDDGTNMTLETLNKLYVPQGSANKAKAAEARINEYFGGYDKVSVSVKEANASQAAELIGAEYMNDDGAVTKAKATYVTEYGIAFYSSENDTSKESFLGMCPFANRYNKHSKPDFSKCEKTGKIDYALYTVWGDEMEDHTVYDVSAYQTYIISVTRNGTAYTTLFTISEASAKEIASLNEDAIAHYNDAVSKLSINGEDGTIPFDTTADITKLNSSSFVNASEVFEGTDLDVYEIEPYSSFQGRLRDLGDSEMEVWLPVNSQDGINIVYCFDKDKNITDEIYMIDRYEVLDGEVFAVFRTDHFSTYGVMKAENDDIPLHEHEILKVTAKASTCTKTGNSEYYACKYCGKHFTDISGEIEIDSKACVIKADGHRWTSHKENAKIGIAGRTYEQCIKCGAVTDEKVLKALSPTKTKIKKLTSAKNGFTIKWAKKSYNGYQIRYSSKSSMKSAKTVIITKAGTVSKKITKLKKKKRYYVQVRTYKIVKSKKCYSGWSTKKSVKTR